MQPIITTNLIINSLLAINWQLTALSALGYDLQALQLSSWSQIACAGCGPHVVVCVLGQLIQTNTKLHVTRNWMNMPLLHYIQYWIELKSI